MFKKQFEIRWSDLDPNVHMANSAYTNFMSDTRLAFFAIIGLPIPEFRKYNLSPVVLYEYIHYFKEIEFGSNVLVTLSITGLSKDGMLFRFDHNFYDSKGKNLASCEIFGAWIDSKTRKLSSLPDNFVTNFENYPKSNNFQKISLEDLRKKNKRPIDLEQ